MPGKYFVVDTNVIVSAAVFSSMTPAMALRQMISLGSIVFSEAILQEYAETLSNKKFDKYLSNKARLIFLEKLISEGVLVTVTNPVKICRDPKDDKYLEVAIACNAACIVTGDNDLLVLHPFENIPILKPADFLASPIVAKH